MTSTVPSERSKASVRAAELALRSYGNRAWLRAISLLIVTTLINVGVLVWAGFEQAEIDQRFIAWVALVFGLGCTSGAVAEFGIRRCYDIQRIRHVRLGEIVPPLGAAYVLTCATLGVGSWLTFSADAVNALIRGLVLVSVAVLAATPSAAAMFAVRRAAQQLPGSDLGVWIDQHRELRANARRLLPAMGALVAFTTFALGAARLALPPGEENFADAASVVVFGASGTAFVALIYFWPHQVLQQQARALASALQPLADAVDDVDLASRLEAREKTERNLGLGGNLFGELQTAVVVVAPLLSAGAALYI
jgi:hypothetical protein